MLTEFGGIAFSKEEKTWGCSRAGTAAGFAERHSQLLAVVRSLLVLTGFYYTQFADTYQEANGLLFADRTPKFPLEEIARAIRGHPNARCFSSSIDAAHYEKAAGPLPVPAEQAGGPAPGSGFSG